MVTFYGKVPSDILFNITYNPIDNYYYKSKYHACTRLFMLNYLLSTYKIH